MIWATVSSQSCFCWLYRASPSLTAKNIINLISVFPIWWCPCEVFSCVVGRGYSLWPVSSLGKTLLDFALLYSVLQGQICLLLQVFLDFLLFSFRTFFLMPWDFLHKQLFSANRTVLILLFQSVSLISFSCLIALIRISHMMSNRSSESECPYPISDLMGKVFGLSLVSMTVARLFVEPIPFLICWEFFLMDGYFQKSFLH